MVLISSPVMLSYCPQPLEGSALENNPLEGSIMEGRTLAGCGNLEGGKLERLPSKGQHPGHLAHTRSMGDGRMSDRGNE